MSDFVTYRTMTGDLMRARVVERTGDLVEVEPYFRMDEQGKDVGCFQGGSTVSVKATEAYPLPGRPLLPTVREAKLAQLLRKLLNTSDLNMESLEEDTIEAIDETESYLSANPPPPLVVLTAEQRDQIERTLDEAERFMVGFEDDDGAQDVPVDGTLKALAIAMKTLQKMSPPQPAKVEG